MKIAQDIDNQYIEIFLEPLRRCQYYKPKLGTNNKSGVDLSGFKTLYGADPFYAWIGLDSELMYSAHKAAGGMTSVYRQVGIGCERLFRKIIIDQTGYEDASLAEWSYLTKTNAGKTKKLSLDARLELDAINNDELKKRLQEWLDKYCEGLEVETPKNGVVFEVRQGYKSKDSKRQNGDIDNATVAWSKGYLPMFSIFSSQIDSDIVNRYRNSNCGILVGTSENDPQSSLYAFCNSVLDFDLAAFFERNTDKIRAETLAILEKLLSPN